MFTIALLLVQSFLFNNPLLISRRSVIQNSILTSSIDPLNKLSSRMILASESEEQEDSSSKIIFNAPSKKIYFSGEVNDESCIAILQTIHTIQSQFSPSEVDHIDLYIQSKGGSLLPTLGLADWIISSDVPIYTWITGYAASAATLLSCVGAKRFMTKHSVMLLHQLSMGMDYGKFAQIEDVKPPAECCICVFHGDPNPHNCEDPWVEINWS